MKVLVACEESQAVTKELRNLGHEAYSCDIEPCSGGHPEWHIQADVIPLLNGDCSFRTVGGMEHIQSDVKINRLLQAIFWCPAKCIFIDLPGIWCVIDFMG